MSDVFKAMVAAFYNDPYAVTYVSDGDGDEREIGLSEWAVEKGMQAALAAAEAAGYALVPLVATDEMAAAMIRPSEELYAASPDDAKRLGREAWAAMIAKRPYGPSKEPSE
jgi:hypothetical protein